MAPCIRAHGWVAGGTYTTDIAVDAELERVWIAGWKKTLSLGGGSDQLPGRSCRSFAVRSYAPGNFNERVIRGYDWGKQRLTTVRWLNRLDKQTWQTPAPSA